MRLFFLALLISSKAFALDVIASGEGNNFEEALTNAKVVALDKVNGAWVHGDSFVRDNMFSEKITQYNGGVIRKYEVLKSSPTTVTIKADVVPRSNEMTSNTVNVTADMKQELKSRVANQAALEKAKQVVDSRERAIAFKPTKVMYINKGDTTTVVMNGEVSFQKKWLEDYKALQEMSGNSFDLDSFYKPVYVNVSGMDGHTEATKSNFRFRDDLGLYSFTGNGVRLTGVKEYVQLTFTVKTSDLLKVDKFEVKFL
jgi:hypothetical protein